MIQIESKLPAQGVTIFSVMSAMAQRLNALNLSQGFPDFPAPPALLNALSHAHNRVLTNMRPAMDLCIYVSNWSNYLQLATN